MKSSRRNEIPRNGSKSVTIPNQHVSELDHCNGMDRTARTLFGQRRHAHSTLSLKGVVMEPERASVPSFPGHLTPKWLRGFLRLAPELFLNRPFKPAQSMSKAYFATRPYRMRPYSKDFWIGSVSFVQSLTQIAVAGHVDFLFRAAERVPDWPPNVTGSAWKSWFAAGWYRIRTY